jgi:hypothetical protein
VKTSPLLAALVLITCQGACQPSAQDDLVLTVDQLKSSFKYSSKIVDVSGEIIMDYHGPTLCNQHGTQCFFIVQPTNVDPKPNFELKKDHMYDEYERLAIEVGLVQRKLGKSKLLATLRGRYDDYILLPNGEEVIVQKREKGNQEQVRCRFVLQKVLKLEVQNLGTK